MGNQQATDTDGVRITALDPDARLSAASSQPTLYRDYADAYRVWFGLYCDTEWWVRPHKRRAMLLARRAYQDASLAYLCHMEYLCPSDMMAETCPADSEDDPRESL